MCIKSGFQYKRLKKKARQFFEEFSLKEGKIPLPNPHPKSVYKENSDPPWTNGSTFSFFFSLPLCYIQSAKRSPTIQFQLRRMCIHCLQGYELNRCHGSLSAVHFSIANSKILLVTCLPTQNMEYLILVSQTSISSCTFCGFSDGSCKGRGIREGVH